MASIRQRDGRYQVQIRRKGFPTRTKSFTKLKDAERWGRAQEPSIDNLEPFSSPPCRSTFSDLAQNFKRNVLPSLKGERQERSRLAKVEAEFGRMLADEIRNHHLASYRDRRLREVGPQTVKHEINLIRRILKLASDEWCVSLPHGIPSIRMPKLPRGRDRRVSVAELETISSYLTPVMAAVVTIAVETAMRRSEILNTALSDLEETTILIRESKNSKSRTVPLSKKACTAFKTLFNHAVPKANSVSQAFNRACRHAGIEDLRFHDLRHEAVSRMFDLGLPIPLIAAISGHQDLRMLSRYAHPSKNSIQLALNHF